MSEAAIEQLLALRGDTVVPLAEALRVELAPQETYTAPPMVLFLGNHSSGKSSLINHLLGERVQRTGVAPTDDGFTVIFHSETDSTLDGQALVTRPDLPFRDLASFGPGLTQHLHGRGMANERLKDIRLIDSPGMIDAGGSDAERPYDFPSVVRNFADAADLVLLFFDPEKPGTTGETLETLTQSLAGIDHKLRIVMNKMDLFEGLRDFARTYGALCWNLSRSLPTKDLPHIYTTAIPELARDQFSLPLDTFAEALQELEEHIDDLPRRRADAVVSRAIDEAKLLHLRGTMVRALRRKVFKARALWMLFISILTLGLGGVCWWYLQQGEWLNGLLYAGGAVAIAVGGGFLSRTVKRWAEKYYTDRIESLFADIHRPVLATRDYAEDLRHDWNQVRGPLMQVLRNLGLDAIGRVGAGRLKRCGVLAKETFPSLRNP